MSIIKIEDIAFVRFAAPDLREMRSFLTEFGLSCFDGADGRLYAKGRDGTPFVHATEIGKPAFRGLGLRAQNIADLQILAAAEGVAVEDLAEPGGGKVVRLIDPDGVSVEVVAGQIISEAPQLEKDTPRNSAGARPRQRSAIRLHSGPANVIRLGHCVLNVGDFKISESWYKHRVGFITSDEIEARPGTPMGAFMRCDRGAIPTDHHTLFLAQLPSGRGFNHAAFEVAGFDDLMLGHDHLKSAKRTPAWGVGRHILGSQIFDYWKDPWGHELEHWTDGDVFTADDGSNKATVQDLLAVQWGPAHPMFVGKFAPSPRMVGFIMMLSVRIKSLFRRSPQGATE